MNLFSDLQLPFGKWYFIYFNVDAPSKSYMTYLSDVHMLLLFSPKEPSSWRKLNTRKKASTLQWFQTKCSTSTPNRASTSRSTRKFTMTLLKAEFDFNWHSKSDQRHCTGLRLRYDCGWVKFVEYFVRSDVKENVEIMMLTFRCTETCSGFILQTKFVFFPKIVSDFFPTKAWCQNHFESIWIWF